MTDFCKYEQGVVITLSLLDDDKNKIQANDFSQFGLEDWKKGDGLDNLKNFIDSQLMKDVYKNSRNL